MPEIPAALAAALLPHYRVQREIGAGGMATVYLAHDVKHDRDVAIKVLKRELAAVVGADRFVSEIRTTAHLRHPHILPLFDSGTADGVPFYVMPFVEGESLRARLRHGTLPIAQAIGILREIADALAHAHASGIIHRDVKPDNVLLSGRHVFLADFGVARAVAAHVGDDQTVTGTSVLVGTPAYMAPEQIASGAVDHRSDIYAFGVMAYELLTGAPPFTGTRQQILTAHLTDVPKAVTVARPEVPAPVADAVARCLQKRPDRRWSRIDDVVPTLERAAAIRDSSERPPAGSRLRYTLAAGGLVVAVAVAAAYYTRSGGGSDSIAVGRITRITTEPGLELDPAISPDGKTIAYAAGIPGSTRIYVRQLASGRRVPLTEEGAIEGQRSPHWSPDGNRILFQAGRAHVLVESPEGGALFLAPAFGGIARRITGELPLEVVASPSWSTDGRRIAFAGADGLYVAPADDTATPIRVTTGREIQSPAWSPDNARIAFVDGGIVFALGRAGFGNLSTSTIFILDIGSRRVTRVTNGNWLEVSPVWMPDGRSLLFVSSRGGGRDVFRQRLLPDGQPDGEPERVSSGLNAHGISLSRDGRLLAYSSLVQRSNIWSVAIPEGRVASVREAEQVTLGTDRIEKLAISPDGRWLAYDSDRDGQANIYKMPLPAGSPEQITHGPNNKFVNDWSPDGREIVYHSMREGGQRDVFVVTADGMKTEQVTSTPAEEQHAGWGADGDSIIYDFSTAADPTNQIYLVRRARRGEPWGPPRRLTNDGSNDPKWSPDGRFIAYCVNGELRVIAPDGSGQRTLVPVSPDRLIASYPIWSRDSRTIYYKAYDPQAQSSIWSVPVQGGPPTLLVAFDDPSRRSLRREFATDGRRLYFTIANDESDLWTMELIAR